jgi:hypothetical protein
MPKLVLDDTSITALVSEIAPLVSAITGWDLQLGGLRCRVLPKDQGYEEIVENKMLALGLSFIPERDIVTRTVEYLVENNILAAYEALTNELMVVRENVDDSNLDGLKVVLGHELTHRGQHIAHPQLFARLNRILAEMIKGLETGQVDLHKLRGYFEEVRPLMTLSESHASYVQGILLQRYFPQAQIEHHSSLPVLLFRVLGYGKVAQYTEGLPQVAAAALTGGIDGLFRMQSTLQPPNI